MVRVFANGPGDPRSIPGQVIPKSQKMVLDTSLPNTQQFKVGIKGKVEQFREGSCALPHTHRCSNYRKGAFGSPSTKVANFTFILLNVGFTTIYIYIYIIMVFAII